MQKKHYVLATALLLSATIFSCKKDSQSVVQEDDAAKIIKINNTSSSDRIDFSRFRLNLTV